MNAFRETTYLSEILEKSNTEPVIIFKYSETCSSSSRTKNELEKWTEAKNILVPIYIVTVQKHKSLSGNIAELFNTKHESPQILIINKQKLVYTAHHNEINSEKFVFQ